MEISFGNIILLLAFICSIVIFCVCTFFNPHPTSSKFLLIELLKQSSLVYFLVQVIGIIYYTGYLTIDKAHILPLVIGISVYILTITMGYAQMYNCKKPKRTTILLQSLKPVIAVIVTSIIILKVPILSQGFYDLVGKESDSDLAMYSSLGFWMAGSLWPSIPLAYFSIEQDSCSNNSEINVTEIPDKVPIPVTI
mgnify:FL=1|tara:strand:+ start:1289 stop:1873 length:585 start_codon:yes stop_codon:yes gene_type:complete